MISQRAIKEVAAVLIREFGNERALKIVKMLRHVVGQFAQAILRLLAPALGVACGGDPVTATVGPPPPPLRGAVVIGVVGGQGQVDTVARLLPQAIVAQATDSATQAAAPNVVVN